VSGSWLLPLPDWLSQQIAGSGDWPRTRDADIKQQLAKSKGVGCDGIFGNQARRAAGHIKFAIFNLTLGKL
jgi:hypothetical protein